MAEILGVASVLLRYIRHHCITSHQFLPHQFLPVMSGLSNFKQSFKGDIVTPDDDGYTQAIARWATNAERNARIVAFVKDTDDVALALKYARTNNL